MWSSSVDRVFYVDAWDVAECFIKLIMNLPAQNIKLIKTEHCNLYEGRSYCTTVVLDRVHFCKVYLYKVFIMFFHTWTHKNLNSQLARSYKRMHTKNWMFGCINQWIFFSQALFHHTTVVYLKSVPQVTFSREAPWGSTHTQANCLQCRAPEDP